MVTAYIHGSSETERQRLALMNDLINARCLEALAPVDERLVLDVGAGTGQFTRLLAGRLAPAARVIAVERNPEQIEAALQLAGTGGEGCPVEFRQGDATRLPLTAGERGRVDLAHTRFLLEHVPDPLAVVREMVAAVRPGGRVVLLDDDHELMRFWPEPAGLMAAWQAYWRSYRALGCDPLVGRRLAALLHAAGARPVRITQLFYGACAGEPAFQGIVGNLLGVLGGARDEVLDTGEITAAAYDRAIDGLRELAGRPEAAVWYVINWAEGRRPG